MENRLTKSLLSVIILCALGGIIGFASGVQYQKSVAPIPQPTVPGLDFSIVWQAFNELDKSYLRPLDLKKMSYGAAKGMVESLGDPYTVFLEPQNAQALEEDISGEFEGVGMIVDKKDGYIVAVSPIKGSPAEAVGLKPGDKILKVDATSTDGIDLDQVVKMIRGKKGTQVKLTIARGEVNANNIREFVITRDVINVPSVELDFVKSPDGEEIAHLTVSQYTMNTHRDFQKAMREVDQKKIRRLIIDLRNNPGGLLDQATALSEYFLKKGDVIVIEGGGKVSEEKIYTAFEDGKYREMPLAVLINKGSASGAEIMAAALHDNGRAKLIGETTFGKGSVQMPLKLRDGAMLKMTIAQWMTPKKEIIDQKGIVPDIEIKLSENGTSSAAQNEGNPKDVQLEKAIEIIKTID